jgi:ADP-ribose pyrophosphatase YjhB (NUDIX family)
MNNNLLNDILRIKALAETGLIYCKNEYDIDRYKELQEISVRMMSEVSGQDIEALKINLPLSADYPTAKVDIRCFVLSEDNKILLVRESLDGKWSLPGGWADVGYTPKETAIKECKEETGLDVEVAALLAVFDKKMHPHPPEPFYVYKMVFYCKAISAEITQGWDVLDVQYFDINELPDLSKNRILKSQIELVYQKVLAKDFETYCD